MLMRSWNFTGTNHLLLTSPVRWCGLSRGRSHILMNTLYPGCTKHLSDPTWNMETLVGIHTIRWTIWQWKRLAQHLKHLSYEGRLLSPRFPSLLFRNRGRDMIQVCGVNRLDTRTFFDRALNERTSGHRQRLFVGRNQKQNTFSQRVVQGWNSLSDHVATATTLNYFKSRLGNYWKDDMYKMP